MNSCNRITQAGKRFCVILGALALALCGAGSARAHANLVQSQPAVGASLTESPPAVTLAFSEALDAGATAVELRDGQSQLVVAGPGMIDPDDPRQLRLPLPPLPDGTYSAIWQARSAVDGHITTGTVAFTVGVGETAVSLLLPPGAPEPATARPAAVDTLARWLNYLAATIAVGSLLFGRLMWRPAYRRWSSATKQSDVHAARLLRRLALLGSGLWAAATLMFVMVQAGQVNAGTLWQGASTILSGRSGLLVGARLGLLLLLALLVRRLLPAGTAPTARWNLAAFTGGLALLTFSLQSHSAALPGAQAWLATAFDWLHLLAMAAWMGGLLPLFLLLWLGRAQPGLAYALAPCFSRVALASVAVLTLTGGYSAWTHVQTTAALTATTHGRALGLKVGLFTLIMLLGAVNLLWLPPQLRQNEAAGIRQLRRTVRLELALGIGVVLLASVMTGIAPAFEALEAQHRLGFRESVQVDDVQMVLRIAPLQLGDNEFAVDVRDERAGAQQSPPLALLRFRNENEAMGELQVEMEQGEGGRFSARGAYLANAGNWRVELILRRPGFDDVRHTFDVVVETEHQHHGNREGK